MKTFRHLGLSVKVCNRINSIIPKQEGCVHLGMMASPEVVRLPRDHRGWSVLQVNPTGAGASLINVSIDGKTIQLVTQRNDPLRVYVNPLQEGADEWQVPAGTGPRVSILPPANLNKPNAPQTGKAPNDAL